MKKNAAVERLKAILEMTGIQIKPSYNPKEVGLILGIHYHTFRKMCLEFEVIDGKPKPGTLNSFWVRAERRVLLTELARYMAENNVYVRETQ